jgi:hypothetical protein
MTLGIIALHCIAPAAAAASWCRRRPIRNACEINAVKRGLWLLDMVVELSDKCVTTLLAIDRWGFAVVF